MKTKRAAIVFLPPANPSYMPLGLASLAEYLRSYGCDALAIDLNIRLWNKLSAGSEESRICRDFFQGKAGNFFDKSQYVNYLQSWGQMANLIERYSRLAADYLENDNLNDTLEAILKDFCERIFEFEPDLLGISIMYPGQAAFSLALAKYIRSDKSCEKLSIILGGASTSIINSDQVLNSCNFVDAIFSGEGEIGLKMLCGGNDFEQINGLNFRKNNKILKNNKPQTLSLSQAVLPLFEDFKIAEYFNPSPVVPVIYSRGCKWRRCRFCAHNFSYSGYRTHNIDRFVDYLESIVDEVGASHFYFADQYVDACDIKALSEKIISRKLNIAFHIMGRPTSDYTADLLDTISQAGCRWISWGIESGSQRLLDISGKGTNVDQAKRVIEDAYNASISNLPMMIYGLPTSSDFDLELTFDFIDDIAGMCDDITSSSFCLFDKTAFAAQASKYNLKITGKEVLLNVNGKPIHSSRLNYQEICQDEFNQSPRGKIEVDKWRRRRKLMMLNSNYSHLCCEHYLLYAQHYRTPENRKPLKAAGF